MKGRRQLFTSGSHSDRGKGGIRLEIKSEPGTCTSFWPPCREGSVHLAAGSRDSRSREVVRLGAVPSHSLRWVASAVQAG